MSHSPALLRPSPTLRHAARASLLANAVAILALVALHALSPEFDPSWRMISEYANGGFAWVLTVFFFAWALGSWTLAAALWIHGGSWVYRVGVVLVGLAGVGEVMGGLFDVNHPLHGAAFGLGVPSLAVGAVLVGVSLARRDGALRLGALSQAPWLSVVGMAASFMLCFSSAEAAGITLNPGEPWGEVPAGVTAVMGWANRLLVLAYVGWAAAAARYVERRAEG